MRVNNRLEPIEPKDGEPTPSNAAMTRRGALLGGAAFATLVPWRQASAAATSQATPSGGWQFTDDRGVTVSVPQRPQRILADMMVATALWDLGYVVAGVWGSEAYLAHPNWADLSSYTGDGVTEVSRGSEGTPDIEKVAALAPDLIVGITYFGDDFYFIGDGDQAHLDRLAPTLGFSNGGVSIADLQARLDELAIALGVDTALPDVIARKERFQTAETSLVAAVTEKPDLNVLFMYGATDQVYVANPNAWGDLRYFAELGLNIVPTVESDATDYYWDLVSWEQIVTYPADLIALGNEERPYIHADNPVWNLLPAVQAGQVVSWGTNAPPSYQSTAYLLETLTAAIAAAEVIV